VGPRDWESRTCEDSLGYRRQGLLECGHHVETGGLGEETLAQDRDGERGHLTAHIESLARTPRGGQCRDDIGHGRGVRGDMSVMERWLHQAPLTAVEGSVGNTDPLAEQGDQCFKERTALGDA
jgi:hypothetical protein